MSGARGEAAAYVGLGANEGDALAALRGAVAALAATPGVRVDAVSPVYRTEAHTRPGQGPQPDYLNAAAALATTLAPLALLDALLAAERTAGRDRSAGTRWGPRPLDLDLLLYDGLVLDEPGLTVPHPRLADRRFVLRPLADVAPAVPVPGTGATVAALLARCADGARVEPTAFRLD